MSGGRQQHDDERNPAMEGIRPLVAGDPERIGPYPLLGRLGAGGMGRVYLARSTGMCRDTDASFFAVDGSGILHDVGPAHGSGYRYHRA